MKKCCLYLRYSSNKQTEQSIEGQDRVCREFCKREGYKVVATYIDRATSANKDIEKRTEFLRMIKESEKGLFDAVVVYKLDRFSRSRYDAATYKYKLKKNGVALISATEPISDNPEGIILESVLEGMAEYYSAELSQKIKRGLRESALKDQYATGRVPYGYKVVDKHYVIAEHEAEGVRLAFKMYADGATLTSVARTLNDHGFRSIGGKMFVPQSFRKMFTNEKYIGVYRYGDYVSYDAVPAIVDNQTFARVQDRTKRKRPSGTYKAKIPYLLTGKAYCGHCGVKLNGGVHEHNGKEYRYYHCPTKRYKHACDKKSVPKEALENAVVAIAKELLTDENIELIADMTVKENLKDIESNTNINALRKELHKTETSLNNMVCAIETGGDIELLVSRMRELQTLKKDIEKRLSAEMSDKPVLKKENIVAWLKHFRGSKESDSFDRQLIELFVNRVTVYDENGKHRVDVVFNLTSEAPKSVVLSRASPKCVFDALRQVKLYYIFIDFFLS